MDFAMVFCSDGALRQRQGAGTPLIPAAFVQRFSGQGAARFAFSHWTDGVVFEDGLTVGSFLSCLSPWDSFWSDFTGWDVRALLAESRRPAVVGRGKRPPDWIGLSKGFVVQMEGKVRFEPISPAPTEGCAGNRGGFVPRLISKQLCRASGFFIGARERVASEGLSIGDLVNVPMFFHEGEVVAPRPEDKRTDGFSHGLGNWRAESKDSEGVVVCSACWTMGEAVGAFFKWFEGVEDDVSAPQRPPAQNATSAPDSVSGDQKVVSIFGAMAKRNNGGAVSNEGRAPSHWDMALSAAKADPSVVLRPSLERSGRPPERRVSFCANEWFVNGLGDGADGV